MQRIFLGVLQPASLFCFLFFTAALFFIEKNDHFSAVSDT